MSISVLNTDAGLSGKTIVNVEDAQNITGLKTYNRSPNAPFAVQAGSAVVSNLDSDKLDGVEGASFLRSDAADIKDSGALTFNDSVVLYFGTGQDAALYYDGTDMILNTGNVGTGVLRLDYGKVKFPATQSASSDANVLDDYEEGTWTPSIGGSGGQSGQAYTTQVGTYVKIGQLVHVQGTIVLSTLGTVTTSAQVQGLPFTSHTTANNNAGLCVNYWAALTNAQVTLRLLISPNTTAATIYGATAAATGLTALVQADLSNTTAIYFSGTYRASA